MASGTQGFSPLPRAVAVAYSGGRDSTALLHATIQAAIPHGVQVHALHVHHGLSPRADAWLATCEQQCLRWKRRGWPVQFAARHLINRPPRGASIEAWAREQRYAELRTMALERGVRVVLLAHHQHDQAETFLLQALRGAGAAGLAGMPRTALRDGIEWCRPWLDQPRSAIDNYARQFRLKWIEDDSNEDDRFVRNRLRAHVMPVLDEKFASASAALARSASWAAQASECLDELADIDMHTLAGARGLHVAAWRQLGLARRANALRAWLAAQGAPDRVSTTLTTRLMDELVENRPARWSLGQGTLRLYRGWLTYCAATAATSPSTAIATAADHEADIAADNAPAMPVATHVNASRSGAHPLPGCGGTLIVRRCRDGGVPIAWLAHLELRPRVGGERFQAGIGRPPRSLKKQYQAAAVPEWHRAGPLIYSGGQLVFVPGLGLDARVLALAGQPQASLEWRASD
jgi:tRNA(Ile)-lysidine synthase